MKAWALKEFTARDGQTYQPGDPLELPRNTDEEKAEVDRLLDYGIITTKPKEAQDETAPPEDETGRTGRSRRS